MINIDYLCKGKFFIKETSTGYFPGDNNSNNDLKKYTNYHKNYLLNKVFEDQKKRTKKKTTNIILSPHTTGEILKKTKRLYLDTLKDSHPYLFATVTLLMLK